MMRVVRRLVVGASLLAVTAPEALEASGHGPVFGATTPTLGAGGWSVDQAWTGRFGDEKSSEQMIKTMIGFGITENLQISTSFPELMTTERLPAARMMSLMSSAREIEALAGYRFQVQPVGIGGRRESTLYVGGTAPLESQRGETRAGPSVYLGAATGYASRAHYVWVGGGIQSFAPRGGDRLGGSRFASLVYGFRPKPLRTEAGKPDLRFFVEATGEDRSADRVAAATTPTAARSVFVGPTALLLYKAYGLEGGMLFPAYQQVDSGRPRERYRVAVNVSFFFFPK
jgi:hypothetical protein